MGKTYDNIEDVRNKLLGTIVYYNEVPVVVKDVQYNPDDSQFYLYITKNLVGRGFDTKPLTDPGFNFTRFNLGYANYGDNGAVWWYRLPAKQYQQGLKANQLNYRFVNPNNNMVGFKASGPVELMLLNKYPSFDEAMKTITSSADQSLTVAFHKDFAMSWDKIHKDFLLEYKGKLIGHMPGNDVKLINEFEHLYESCKEAIGVR